MSQLVSDYTDKLPVHPTKRYKLRKLSDIKRIVVHTTDADWSIETLAKYDINPNHISSSGCPKCTYHEVIMKNGMVYWCVPYEEITWHVGVWNPGSVGVALMYRCSDLNGKDVYAPREEAVRSLITRCNALCFKFGLSPSSVVGHRELKGTGWLPGKGSRILRKTCPGLKLNLDQLRTSIASRMQTVLRLNGYDGIEVDGIWGPISKMAFDIHQRRMHAQNH